jgi:predicted acetyltransferase
MSFINRLKRRDLLTDPVFSNGIVDLYPINAYEDSSEIGAMRSYGYIIAPGGLAKEAGRISLRVGESRSLYYFGHIGYHIDKGYRGQHYALHACRLIAGLCRELELHSVVITTNVDNPASRKTCESLGCILESVVFVPEDLRARYGLPPLKCRYILLP